MFLSWTVLFLLLAAAALVWFWQDSLAARERANAAAMEACERLSLQFLDGTVAFARISLRRGTGGRLALRRTYVFDYTATSIDRLQGFVVLTGHRVETVGYAAQTPTGTTRTAQPQQPASGTQIQPPAQPSNVLELERWRTEQHPRRDDRRDRHG